MGLLQDSSRLLDGIIKHVDLPQVDSVCEYGNNNTTTFRFFPHLSLSRQSATHNEEKVQSIQGVPIVVSQRNSHCEDFSKGQDLFVLRGGKVLLSPFIMKTLYHGILSGKMTRITVKATGGDFVTYAETPVKPEDPEECYQLIKMLAGQMVLAIAWLHQRNMVHRDIKNENFLVTIKGKGMPHLELGDLDDILPVNAAGQIIAPISDRQMFVGTPDFSDPAILALMGNINELKTSFTAEEREQYQKLNLKACDCYSLGRIFKTLVKALPKDAEEKKLLEDLAARLTDLDVSKRCTIEEVQHDRFFGETKEERETYFAALTDCFNQDLYLDGFILQGRKKMMALTYCLCQ